MKKVGDYGATTYPSGQRAINGRSYENANGFLVKLRNSATQGVNVSARGDTDDHYTIIDLAPGETHPVMLDSIRSQGTSAEANNQLVALLFSKEPN